jgi:hypothetical protein
MQQFKRTPPSRTWWPPVQCSPKPLSTSNSPSHECAPPASQPLPHQQLPPQQRKPVSAPPTGATPNQLGTRSGNAGHRHTNTRSKLATTASCAHCARPAISPAQPGQTSWVATLTTPVTLPPLHYIPHLKGRTSGHSFHHHY